MQLQYGPCLAAFVSEHILRVESNQNMYLVQKMRILNLEMWSPNIHCVEAFVAILTATVVYSLNITALSYCCYYCTRDLPTIRHVYSKCLAKKRIKLVGLDKIQSRHVTRPVLSMMPRKVHNRSSNVAFSEDD